MSDEQTETGQVFDSPDDPPAQPGEEGGTVWDAPNQQVVRDDASAPWDEGGGGGEGQPEPHQQEPDETQPVEETAADEEAEEEPARKRAGARKRDDDS